VLASAATAKSASIKIVDLFIGSLPDAPRDESSNARVRRPNRRNSVSASGATRP
jgi:hypothetical protein